MKKKLLIVLFFLFTSFFVNAQDQLVIKAATIPSPDTVWVFRPSNPTQKKTPLLFLLHGWSGSYKQWNSIIDLQQLADNYGFHIVCPDGFYDSWYVNSTFDRKRQFTSFFFDKLYPEIVSNYPVDTSQVFISGLSMGGHGALSLYCERPDLFKSAGSTSGGVDLSVIGTFKNQYGINKILGSFNESKATWAHFSVLTKIERLNGLNKEFIFDCGTEDFFYTANNALRAKCDELKIKATYISQPGNHNREYWKKSIVQHMLFFKELIQSSHNQVKSE
ncbi:alpha/beta hydrolase [Solitalea lacus]|uniref:alpha/beta hydrolase n=1 Tax=Solitalea lacus TaxID=2911172 RepID=UPI001EDAB217|nr:alpha/beta hydrolase family protein [Solitalea lacus]UKJ08084.1 esterase family protein [Solitalea lacus]